MELKVSCPNLYCILSVQEASSVSSFRRESTEDVEKEMTVLLQGFYFPAYLEVLDWGTLPLSQKKGYPKIPAEIFLPGTMSYSECWTAYIVIE